EGTGGIWLKARETGFFRPDAKQAQVDGLAGVDPFFFGIELLVTMPDLVSGAIGEAHGACAVGSDLPEIEFVVENHGGVLFGPASDAKGRLLLDGPVGFAVHESDRKGTRHNSSHRPI